MFPLRTIATRLLSQLDGWLPSPRTYRAWALALACLLTAASAPTRAEEPYRLAAGDQVYVAVIGEQELSGDYIVDGSGELPVPLLGVVKVAGLTIEEARDRIAAGLANGYVQQPSVFVRIARMRPIHVLGAVRKPGSYPYELNSLAKTAIAQAGGFGIGEQIATAMADFLTADERVRSLVGTRDRLAIRKARLDAQLKEQPAFHLPPGLVGPADTLSKIKAEEEQALQVSVGELNKQREGLREQIKQITKEDAARVAQIAVEKTQATLIQRRIDEYDRLAQKGLGRNSTSLELQLALANKNADVMRLEVDRSRLQINANEVDNRLKTIEAAFKQQILIELNDVRQRLHDAEVALPSAREQRLARMQLAGAGGTPSENYEITVTRMTPNGQPVTMRVDGYARIKPGDLIEVKPPQAASTSQASLPDPTVVARP